jgi:beta-aspartyl-peptidase (threonine type)
VGSSNARVGLAAGMAILRRGGSALDAVEAAILPVESNLDDHSVGRGGLPNILGVVELDASIMDGWTLGAGAVAGVRGYEHPISIARRVMDELPHSLLVGEGAERFARECGFPQVDLLTPESRRIYEERLRGEGGGPRDSVLRAISARLTHDPELAHPKDAGTVNVLALDRTGHLAAGVSTSGWSFKYPGRVGDSAVIGAGNYCDDRWGAAACTGRGEMAIRCATAHTIVTLMQAGFDPRAAGLRAMQDLDYLVDPYFGAMNCVVLDPRGAHAAFSTNPQATYVWMDERSDGVQEAPRTHVELKGRTI